MLTECLTHCESDVARRSHEDRRARLRLRHRPVYGRLPEVRHPHLDRLRPPHHPHHETRQSRRFPAREI